MSERNKVVPDSMLSKEFLSQRFSFNTNVIPGIYTQTEGIPKKLLSRT